MSGSRFIAILVNPVSGKGKALKIAQWVYAQLDNLNIKYNVYDYNWPESLTSFTDVWLVGGDGTTNFFINKYKDNELPLSFFKGGRGNDFAWMIYGNISVREQLEIALNGEIRKADAASCNGMLFVNSCGIGFDGAVLRSMTMIRWLGGHAGYLAVVIRKILSFREFVFNIKVGEKRMTGKYLLVIFNNASRTGGGFLVTPKASIFDGQLDFLLCRPLSIWKRLRYLPVIEKGKHLSLPFINYSFEKEVKIELPQPIYGQLDGELICNSKFHLVVLPGKLSIRTQASSSRSLSTGNTGP